MCPYCSKPAKLVDGSVVYKHRADLKHKLFWLCAPCRAWVGCHPNSKDAKPLGTLANYQLRQKRSKIHRIFDPIWQSGMLNRTEAYTQLAYYMGIELKNCHIGHFREDECDCAIACVWKIIDNLHQ